MRSFVKARHYTNLAGIAASLLFVCAAVAQQQQPNPQLNAPPPLRVISAEEKAILADVKDTKSRAKKSIELAEAHLLNAETRTSQDQFTEASAELGRYWALIEDLLNYLSPLNRDSTKTRDLYKRLELSLRAHGPRLTIIRRDTPLEYAVWIKEIEEFARTSRTEALNSFYGHIIVRESPQQSSSDKPSDKRSAETATPPESKQP